MTFVGMYSKRAAHNLDFARPARKKLDFKDLSELEVLTLRKALCAIKRDVTIVSGFDGKENAPETFKNLPLGSLFALQGDNVMYYFNGYDLVCEIQHGDLLETHTIQSFGLRAIVNHCLKNVTEKVMVAA